MMRLITPFLLALTLAACSSHSLPQPQTLPTLPQQASWYKLGQSDHSGNTQQTSLLAVEQLSDGIRFVQTDALGAPLSRQLLTVKGWQNDGFIMPNAASRRLFAALLPLLAADSGKLYPQVHPNPNAASTFCSDGGAAFSYKNQDLWCVACQEQQFVITFPDHVRWTVSPIEE